MKVLLIDPAQRNGVAEVYENLGIASLAACSREAGFETETILTHVEGWSHRKLGSEILVKQPDVLGVSLLSFRARQTLEMLSRLKSEGLQSRIVLGGHFPTFNDRILLEEWSSIDVVVHGEGDLTLVDLLQTWQQGGGLDDVAGISYRKDGTVVQNRARSLIEDLDSLQWPVRDHTERIVGMGGALNLNRSRGCYGNCSFCSISSFYRTQAGAAWRQRSVVNVLAEMAYLADRFPGSILKFHDDQFIGPGKRGWEDAMSFAHTLKDSNIDVRFSIFARSDTIEPELFRILKAAGLESVFVGVESGSQRELDLFNKRTTISQNLNALQILHDLDIHFLMGLILFDPYTEMEDVKANFRFLHETQPLWSSKGNILSVENRVEVYKGTPVYDQLDKEGRLEGDYFNCTYTIQDRRIRFISQVSQLFIKSLLPAFSIIRLLPAHLKLAGHRISSKFRKLILTDAGMSRITE